MPKFWYRDNCPICGPEGELVIARNKDDHLVLVCAECGIGFYDPAKIDDPDLSVDMLGHDLRAATENEIDSAGWHDLRQRQIEAELPG